VDRSLKKLGSTDLEHCQRLTQTKFTLFTRVKVLMYVLIVFLFCVYDAILLEGTASIPYVIVQVVLVRRKLSLHTLFFDATAIAYLDRASHLLSNLGC